jgi:hypothetical protein
MAMKIGETQVRAKFLNLLAARQEQRWGLRTQMQASRMMQILQDLTVNRGFRAGSEVEDASKTGAQKFAAQLNMLFRSPIDPNKGS